MLRKDFIALLKSNKYPITIFESYFKEHSEEEWDQQAFQVWLQSQSMLGDVTGHFLLNKVIPYYKSKFEICEVLDKEGNHIKYVEN